MNDYFSDLLAYKKIQRDISMSDHPGSYCTPCSHYYRLAWFEGQALGCYLRDSDCDREPSTDTLELTLGEHYNLAYSANTTENRFALRTPHRHYSSKTQVRHLLKIKKTPIFSQLKVCFAVKALRRLHRGELTSPHRTLALLIRAENTAIAQPQCFPVNTMCVDKRRTKGQVCRNNA